MMDDQIYAKLDVKDTEGNIVGFSFVKREKISHLESLSMVPRSLPQDKKVEGSISLEEDLEISSSDDEDLDQPSCEINAMTSSSVSSAASSSQDQSSDRSSGDHDQKEDPQEDQMEDQKEDEFEKLLRLVERFEKTRMAKRLHDYSKLMKAFNAGWTRICKVGEGGIIKVSYKSPDGKTFCRSRVVKYLREQDSSLTIENFDFQQKFLGFERKLETISICENYHGQISDRQSKEDPPEKCKSVWLRGGRLPGLQCLLCNKTYGGLRSKVLMSHHHADNHPNPEDPKHICSKCGKTFTRKGNLTVHIENDKCKVNISDSKSTDEPKNPGATGITVKAEKHQSPSPAVATVLIESPNVNGIKRVQVNLRSSRLIGQFLNNLLKSSEYEWSQVEWSCEGTILTGYETAGSLNNKSVVFRIKD